MSKKNQQRGQVHTLESIAAAIIVITSVVFAIQSTAITPLTTSTSHRHIETQQQKMASGVLEQAAETGALQEQVLYWNPDEQRYYNASVRGYRGEYPDTTFGDSLQETFEDRRVAVNVYVTFSRSGNTTGTKTMIRSGTPSDNSVTSTKTIIMYDDMRLSSPASSVEIGETTNTTDYYMKDMYPNSPVYNIVTVRVVTWRI